MKKPITGEAQDLLRMMPIEQLKFFAKIRLNEEDWKTFNRFVFDQKQIKSDQIYRLRRPRDINDVVKNMVDHEYFVSRIAGLVVLLQIMENASEEIERRVRKEK